MDHKFKEFLRYYLLGLLKRLDKHHAFLMAGALTFSIFVCTIPLAFILFWLLGTVLSSNSVELQVNNFIDTLIPYKNYAEVAKSVIGKRINELVVYKDIGGYIGFSGLLFAASGLFSSVRIILGDIFGPSKRIGALLGLLVDMGLVIVLISLFLITMLVTPVMDFLRLTSSKIPYFDFLNVGIFGKAFTSAITFFIITMVYSVFYKIVPTDKIKHRALLLGAASAAFVWMITKEIFGFYLYNYASFGQIYGAYSLGIVIAFWVYTTALLFIVGAEISGLVNEKIFKASD